MAGLGTITSRLPCQPTWLVKFATLMKLTLILIQPHVACWARSVKGLWVFGWMGIQGDVQLCWVVHCPGSSCLHSLYGHMWSYTTIAFSCYWISFWYTCNTTAPLLCSRLALKLSSFQQGTLPYHRYWIKGYINPLNSTWGRKALHLW